MSRKDQYRKMVPEFVRYLNRYVSEYLHESSDALESRAEEIYAGMYAETPEIGGGDNPMAANLYEFMTFCAYYEASEHRIDEDSVPVISGWMLEDKKILGRLVNLNHKACVWLMNRLAKFIADKTEKKKAAGEWGNTWRIQYNPEGHTEGVSMVLYGCPLLAFARAHGYEKMMPKFCRIDHQSAALMHAKLIRRETESGGGSCCNYWFVGDRSETAEKYADFPQI